LRFGGVSDFEDSLEGEGSFKFTKQHKSAFGKYCYMQNMALNITILIKKQAKYLTVSLKYDIIKKTRNL
jgi:hypothetical protein